jgi:hypothetical protein
MIEHRGCNKHVRDRVSAEPSLIEHPSCLFYDFTNADRGVVCDGKGEKSRTRTRPWALSAEKGASLTL